MAAPQHSAYAYAKNSVITMSSRTRRILIFAAILCVLIFTFSPSNTFSSPPTTTPHRIPTEAPKSSPKADTSSEDPRCKAFPDPGNIAIALKTGATEATERIPTLMLTALRCAKSVKIFSDLEQTIGGYHVTDALDRVPASAMEGNTDWNYYKDLKAVEKYGQIGAMMSNAKDPRRPQDLAAWTLDKYKQLHILERLYEEFPDKDYYMMIDADTYLVWPNLVMWLNKLGDPNEKAYYGSPANVASTQFGHGGSGIIFSKATMHEFAVTQKGVASRWDVPMHEECCGDYVIATILLKGNIGLRPSWPTLNGEKPVTIPFGPSHWCQPVATMHHVTIEEMNQIMNFQNSVKDIKKPVVFADLYEHFVKGVLSDSLPNWDSHCLDSIAKASSYDECKKTCTDNDQCFQFSFSGDECKLGYSIHLGFRRGPEDGKTWQSGWLLNRIDDWVAKQKPCGEPKFPWTT